MSRVPFRARCCCSSPEKISPARTEFPISRVRFRMPRCALPRATAWSVCEWPISWRRQTRGPAAPGTSRRRFHGSATTSICFREMPSRSWPSATPWAPLTWRAIWPTRNCRCEVMASRGWCWCPAFIALTRMRVMPKRPILAMTPASTRSGRPFLASPASRRRSCSPGRFSIRRVSSFRAKSSRSFFAASRRIVRTSRCWKAAAGLSSVFARDLAKGSLAEPTLELVRIIEARGLP